MSLPASLENVLNQSPCHLSLMDRGGAILWVSHANYGYMAECFLGKPSDAIILEDDRPIWWDAFRRARDDRQTVRYRLRVGTPEPPHVATLEGRLFPVADGGPVVAVGCVSWDACLGTPERGGVPPGFPARARWLSPLCEKVVAYLDGCHDRWVSSGELAGGVGQQSDNRFKSVLTGLVERQILEARVGAGYRIIRYT